jgi:hypothetical protein
MAKATHGIWEGHWYFEVSLNNNKGNTRIGWSQISGDLQAPCGYDLFSYSFRNAPGNLFHNSRPVKDAPPPYEGGYSNLFDFSLVSDIIRIRGCVGCINIYT